MLNRHKLILAILSFSFSNLAFGKGIPIAVPVESLSQALNETGFPVLTLALRKREETDFKIIMEDIQSAVFFMKTDGRILATRVLIIAEGRSADGTIKYIGANKQMLRIVDGVALIRLSDVGNLRTVVGIPTLLLDPRKNAEAVCQNRCRSVFFKSKLFGTEFRKTLVDFLLKPRG